MSLGSTIAREGVRAVEHSARMAALREQNSQRAQQLQAGLHASTAVAVPPEAAPDRARRALDGNQVLGHAASWLAEYVRYPNWHSLVTAVLWAAHCHARDDGGVLIWNATGRLAFMSTDGDSGKSTAMETIASLCPEAYGLTLRVTEAGIVQAVSRHETLFLDEADGLLGTSARAVAVRTILNGGYTRKGTILNGKGDKATRVSVFGPIAFGGLESILMSPREDMKTLRTRCIVIRMKPSGEELPEWPPRDMHRADVIRAALRDWTFQQRTGLMAVSPELPEGVVRRKAQMWRPLIALADAAGGEWPQAAREACEEMCASVGESAADGLDELEGLGYEPFSPLGGVMSGTVVADDSDEED